MYMYELTFKNIERHSVLDNLFLDTFFAFQAKILNTQIYLYLQNVNSIEEKSVKIIVLWIQR